MNAMGQIYHSWPPILKIQTSYLEAQKLLMVDFNYMFSQFCDWKKKARYKVKLKI